MKSRFKRVAILGLAVAGATWFCASGPALKAQSEQGSFREAFSRGEKLAEPRVRMNYLGASWQRVLEDVSRQMDRELVMDKVPRGRVTRRDRREHTVPQAIRLLNAELEKQGFRVLLQKRHLVVLDLDSARSRYSRPVAGQTQAAAPPAQRDTPPVRTDSQNQTQRRRVVQVSGFQDLDPDMQPAEKPQPIEEQTIKVTNGKAADVAREIYDVVSARSILNKKGLNGLPSFTVFHRTPSGKPSDQKHFEVAIDRANNRLTVAGPRDTTAELLKLVRTLDEPKEGRNQDFRVIPTQHVKAQSVEELERELNRIPRSRQRTSFKANRDNMFFAQNSQDEPPQPSATQAGDDQQSMNLQGDVVIQPLDELGAVVIKGNQSDIDTVVGIIQELEKLSEGTLPEINLVTLDSVNSEALSELLVSVYDRLSELRADGTGSERRNNIGFVPVVKPNAILVLAPTVEMKDILELIENLDKPVNPTYEFEVFQLKNAIASQVVTSLESFYEEPTGLSTRIRAVADVRTNSVIVQARPSDLEEVAALVKKIDQDSAGKVSKIKIVRLKNAVAEELTEIIQTALQNIINPPQQTQNFGQQGSSELRDSQSVVLEFLQDGGTDIERLIRSGILVDVRVIAEPRSNSIIVTAPEPSLELMDALIEELDTPPPGVADIKVFTLERADAEQAVDLLTAIFEDQNTTDNIGVAIQGANDANSTLTPLRFSADVRTNSVLAAGSLESLAIVEAILLRLDESETLTASRSIEVIRLNNIGAQATAAQIAQFLNSQTQLLDQDDLRSGIERLANEVVVDFETESNSLIVSATDEWHARIQELVDKLDQDPRQVVIQALLVEVDLNNNDEFGIELGFQDPFNFLRGASGFNFAGANQLANTNIVSPGTIATQGLSNLGLGRQNTDLGFGGFVFSANSDAVSVLVRALQARRNVQVLSRPMINATNGIEATIQVGQEVPVINGFTTTGLGNIQPTIERDDAGIILRVTPRISEDGSIQMRVYAENSAFNGQGVAIGTDANGNVIESPIKDVSVAEGDIVLQNGQTGVFGGIISKSDETLERKVPWLGDVPLLGQAFRFDATETVRSELLIFLTPRVLKSEADQEVLKQIEAERMHYIESEAEEIHGPIFSVPGRGDGRAPGGFPVDGRAEVIQPTSATRTTAPASRSGNPTRPRGGLLKRFMSRGDN